jgi:hypothetical protein
MNSVRPERSSSESTKGCRAGQLCIHMEGTERYPF